MLSALAKVFAYAHRIAECDLTHFVLVGRDGDDEVFAFGYWDDVRYCHGIVHMIGAEIGTMDYSIHVGLERAPSEAPDGGMAIR